MILTREIQIECSEDFTMSTHSTLELEQFSNQMLNAVEMVVPNLTDVAFDEVSDEIKDLVNEYAQEEFSETDIENLSLQARSDIVLIDLSLTLKKQKNRIAPTLFITIFNT